MFHKRHDIKKDINKKIFSSSCSQATRKKERFESCSKNFEAAWRVAV